MFHTVFTCVIYAPFLFSVYLLCVCTYCLILLSISVASYLSCIVTLLVLRIELDFHYSAIYWSFYFFQKIQPLGISMWRYIQNVPLDEVFLSSVLLLVFWVLDCPTQGVSWLCAVGCWRGDQTLGFLCDGCMSALSFLSGPRLPCS